MTRSPTRNHSARDYIHAGILTAVIPIIGALATYWLAPWGCDANAWLCLLPISLLGVAPVAALCLPFLVYLNRRRHEPFPDGWFPTMSFTGLVAQLTISATSLWLAAPHMRQIFFVDVLIFPHGLVAGALVGTVFWISLAVLRGPRKPDR